MGETSPPSTQFTFLRDVDILAARYASDAEASFLYGTFWQCLVTLRVFAETVTQRIATEVGLEINDEDQQRKSFEALLQDIKSRKRNHEDVPKAILDILYDLKNDGNEAAHPNTDAGSLFLCRRPVHGRTYSF